MKRFLQRLFCAFIAAALFPLAALADGPFQFYTLTPCRAVDTRGAIETNGGPALTGTPRDFQMRGRCGVPLDARAVAINVTVVWPDATSWLILWPSGTPRPFVSTLNYAAGDPPTGNGAIVPVSSNVNDLSVQNVYGNVHVVIDVTGYFK